MADARDFERTPSRLEFQGAPLIVRFRLRENLLPGENAQARILRWNPNLAPADWEELTESSVEITLQASFDRAFGHTTASTGEDGWAMQSQDNGVWEVIGMGGSLHRHGQVKAATIATNASGEVWVYYAQDGTGVETNSGLAVTVKNLGEEVNSGDTVFIWYEPFSEQWYIVSGGGGSNAIVSVYGADHDEAKCHCGESATEKWDGTPVCGACWADCCDGAQQQYMEG